MAFGNLTIGNIVTGKMVIGKKSRRREHQDCNELHDARVLDILGSYEKQNINCRYSG